MVDPQLDALAHALLKQLRQVEGMERALGAAAAPAPAVATPLPGLAPDLGAAALAGGEDGACAAGGARLGRRLVGGLREVRRFVRFVWQGRRSLRLLRWCFLPSPPASCLAAACL